MHPFRPYHNLIVALALPVSLLSCNRQINEYGRESVKSDIGLELSIDVVSLDSVKFILLSNLKDTIPVPAVGDNSSRLYFLLGEERQELEFYRQTSYGSMITLAPGELIAWDYDLKELIKYLGIDTSDRISLYWKMGDFSSDTIKLK